MGSRDDRFDASKSLMQFAQWRYHWLPDMQRRAAARFVAGHETPAEKAQAERVDILGTFADYLVAKKAWIDEQWNTDAGWKLPSRHDFPRISNNRLNLDRFEELLSQMVEAERTALEDPEIRVLGILKHQYQSRWNKHFEGIYDRRRRRADAVLQSVGAGLQRELVNGRFCVKAIVLPDTSHRELTSDDLAGATADLQGNALVNGAVRYEAIAISMTAAAPSSSAILDSTPTGQSGRRPHTGTVFILDRLDDLLADSNQRTRLAGMTLMDIAQDLHDWYRSTKGNDGLPSVATIKNRVRPVLRQAGLVTSLSGATSDRGSGTRPN